MMKWIKDTFSDARGIPSFKRQSSAVLIASCILGTFTGANIIPLAGLVGVILTATAFDTK